MDTPTDSIYILIEYGGRGDDYMIGTVASSEKEALQILIGKQYQDYLQEMQEEYMGKEYPEGTPLSIEEYLDNNEMVLRQVSIKR
jgi:hypothetical protein